MVLLAGSTRERTVAKYHEILKLAAPDSRSMWHRFGAGRAASQKDRLCKIRTVTAQTTKLKPPIIWAPCQNSAMVEERMYLCNLITTVRDRSRRGRHFFVELLLGLACLASKTEVGKRACTPSSTCFQQHSPVLGRTRTDNWTRLAMVVKQHCLYTFAAACKIYWQRL